MKKYIRTIPDYPIKSVQFKDITTILKNSDHFSELIDQISEIITSVNATSMKDMGKVMGIATKKFNGKADNGKIAQIIKEKLN